MCHRRSDCCSMVSLLHLNNSLHKYHIAVPSSPPGIILCVTALLVSSFSRHHSLPCCSTLSSSRRVIQQPILRGERDRRIVDSEQELSRLLQFWKTAQLRLHRLRHCRSFCLCLSEAVPFLSTKDLVYFFILLNPLVTVAASWQPFFQY